MTVIERAPTPRLTSIAAAPIGWAAYYGQNVEGRNDAVMLPVVAWAVNRIPLPEDADDELYEGGPEHRPVAVVATADGRLLTAEQAAADERMELLTIAYGLDGTLPAQVHAWAGQQDAERIRDAHGR